VLVVIKVATKEDAEKLLRMDSISFGGGAIVVLPFEERRTLVACFSDIEPETACDPIRAICVARKVISSARQ
jgi:hypothetical protein